MIPADSCRFIGMANGEVSWEKRPVRLTEKQGAVFPRTHRVNVQLARDTLDYADMISLARMFERWAFDETRLTPDQATECLLSAVDYETIAAWCGPSWKSTDPAWPESLMPFIAKSEASWTERLPPDDIE